MTIAGEFADDWPLPPSSLPLRATGLALAGSLALHVGMVSWFGWLGSAEPPDRGAGVASDLSLVIAEDVFQDRRSSEQTAETAASPWTAAVQPGAAASASLSSRAAAAATVPAETLSQTAAPTSPSDAMPALRGTVSAPASLQRRQIAAVSPSDPVAATGLAADEGLRPPRPSPPVALASPTPEAVSGPSPASAAVAPARTALAPRATGLAETVGAAPLPSQAPSERAAPAAATRSDAPALADQRLSPAEPARRTSVPPPDQAFASPEAGIAAELGADRAAPRAADRLGRAPVAGLDAAAPAPALAPASDRAEAAAPLEMGESRDTPVAEAIPAATAQGTAVAERAMPALAPPVGAPAAALRAPAGDTASLAPAAPSAARANLSAASATTALATAERRPAVDPAPLDPALPQVSTTLEQPAAPAIGQQGSFPTADRPAPLPQSPRARAEGLPRNPATAPSDLAASRESAPAANATPSRAPPPAALAEPSVTRRSEAAGASTAVDASPNLAAAPPDTASGPRPPATLPRPQGGVRLGARDQASSGPASPVSPESAASATTPSSASAASSGQRLSAARVEPLPQAPARTAASAGDVARQGGGECFAGGNDAAPSGQPFVTFEDSFTTLGSFEAGARATSKAACSLISLLKSRGRPLPGTLIDLASSSIVSGGLVAGSIVPERGNADPALPPLLFLIDAAGDVHDARRFLQAGSTGWTFSFPLTLTGDAREAPVLLLAVFGVAPEKRPEPFTSYGIEEFGDRLDDILQTFSLAYLTVRE